MLEINRKVEIIRKINIDRILNKYKCISSYKIPNDIQNWHKCNKCNLYPLIWEFNNGRSTACGCGRNEYDHFSIFAESLMSVINRNNGSAIEYNANELRLNWNEYILNDVILCDRKKLLDNGKW